MVGVGIFSQWHAHGDASLIVGPKVGCRRMTWNIHIVTNETAFAIALRCKNVKRIVALVGADNVVFVRGFVQRSRGLFVLCNKGGCGGLIHIDFNNPATASALHVNVSVDVRVGNGTATEKLCERSREMTGNKELHDLFGSFHFAAQHSEHESKDEVDTEDLLGSAACSLFDISRKIKSGQQRLGCQIKDKHVVFTGGRSKANRVAIRS